jgi:hypothetical protein
LAPLLCKKDKTIEEQEQLKIYERMFNEAVESNLNAYESACSKYIDGKTDKERFIKLYKVEIRQLVEEPELKQYFDALTTRYKAITTVYNEWENLEI